MQSSLQELVRLNPHLPVFSLTGTGIGTVAVGGYVPVYEIDRWYDDLSLKVIDAYTQVTENLAILQSAASSMRCV